MLVSLLLFAAGKVPIGAYGMPELCRKLKEATGILHTANTELDDYAVFVDVKSGDPERVRQLVAAAMRGEWKKDAGKFHLVPTKVNPATEFAEFDRRYKVATKSMPAHAALPTRDLYDMAPGQVIRYSYPQFAGTKPLPESLRQGITTYGSVVVRRQAEGIFEFRNELPGRTSGVFSSEGEVDLKDLPPNITTLFSEDLAKPAITPEDRAEMTKVVRNPLTLDVDWRNLGNRDPVAAMTDRPLRGLAQTVKPDMAAVLPDLAIMTIADSRQSVPTVATILSGLSQVIDWDVVDGAAIGKLPMCDHTASSQARRSAIERIAVTAKDRGVVNVAALSTYVQNQRRAASDSWADAMMLVMAGAVIDERYIGDYPFNVRLYTRLSPADWNLIRSGNPFPAGALSQNALLALSDVLLQSRSRLQSESADPAFWPTLDPNKLSIKAELTDEPVLIGFTAFAASVDSASSAGANYEMRKKELGLEPLYEVAKRKNLKLTITCTLGGEPVATGFTEVSADPSQQPVIWSRLPKPYVDEFKKTMESSRRVPEQIGPPPPTRG